MGELTPAQKKQLAAIRRDVKALDKSITRLEAQVRILTSSPRPVEER